MDEKDRVFARFKDGQPEAAERREQLTIVRAARTSGSRVVEVVRVRGTAPSTDRRQRVDTQVRAASWDEGFPTKRSGSAFSPLEPATAEAQAPVTHVMPAWKPAPAPAPPTTDVAPPQAGERTTALRRGLARPGEVMLPGDEAPMPPPAGIAPAQAAEPAMAPRQGRPRKVMAAAELAPLPAQADRAPAPTAEPPIALRRGRGRPRKEVLGAPARPIADPFDAEDDRANCMRCGYAIDPLRERRGLMTCAPCG